MASPATFDHLFKLLLVGEPGIGKSCLLLRFADDTFAETYVSTIGVDFKIKSVDIGGKAIKLQMWDTAGQERFRTITSSYYRGAHGIMLCFDLAVQSSFEKLSDWLKDVAKYAPSNIAIMLCGLKTDLDDQRSISKEEAEAFAHKNKLRYIEASPKDGTNVNEAFMTLTKDILERTLHSPKPEPPVTVSSSIDTSLPPTESKCNC
eukprot:Phypoly_transcript_12418.p1 GENE.Phypoly_transcript_12418~~Phypoly_transcript_12418.p1  ORF type:complete len:205 (+),score=25.81 Phypoly_transcript_12418:458-1072(+)